MANEIGREEPISRDIQKSDVVLLIGALAAIAAPVLIVMFVRGGDAATLGIIWGWIVNLSIWIYLIFSAI